MNCLLASSKSFRPDLVCQAPDGVYILYSYDWAKATVLIRGLLTEVIKKWKVIKEQGLPICHLARTVTLENMVQHCNIMHAKDPFNYK